MPRSASCGQYLVGVFLVLPTSVVRLETPYMLKYPLVTGWHSVQYTWQERVCVFVFVFCSKLSFERIWEH